MVFVLIQCAEELVLLNQGKLHFSNDACTPFEWRFACAPILARFHMRTESLLYILKE